MLYWLPALESEIMMPITSSDPAGSTTFHWSLAHTKSGNIMNTNKLYLLMITAIFTMSAFSHAALAQPQPAQQIVQQNAAPQQAPSFMRQAGQKLFEGAQKQMLQKVHETIQSQQQSEVPTDPLAAGGTVAVSQRQSAPCRSWVRPGEKPIACILCVHGLGLQSNSYEYFGQEQSKLGLAVYAIDVRGFGAWMNANGKTKVNFNECLDDLKQALESIRAANPGIPVYLLGESMGGAIALRAASMYPDLVDGLISSVPAGERFNQGKTSAKVFLNLLTGMNISNIGSEIVNQATASQKLKAQWKGDPLARLNLTPQELIQFQDFMNANHEAAKKVADMPVLFVQGNGDKLVKPEGTWELYNAVASKDKSFFAVPGEHLIFEEAQTQEPGLRDQNFQVIQAWLSTKVGRRERFGRGGLAGGPGAGMGRPGMIRAGGFAGRMGFVNTLGLEGPAQMIENGQYANAIAALEPIRMQRPTDANVLSLLGRAYFQNGETDKAGFVFRQAMRTGRANSAQANALNAYLLGMTQSVQAGLGAGQSVWGTADSGAPIAGGKAKVYAFYSSWADQCKGMIDSVAQLASKYGGRVEINSVNIEDAGADALLDRFKVGPIPTVVFVAPNGQVGPTIIGESTFVNYEQALNSITNPAGLVR